MSSRSHRRGRVTTTRTFGQPETESDADRLIASLGELAALGVGRHVFTLDEPTDPAVSDLLARRIIPAANGLGPGEDR